MATKTLGKCARTQKNGIVAFLGIPEAERTGKTQTNTVNVDVHAAQCRMYVNNTENMNHQKNYDLTDTPTTVLCESLSAAQQLDNTLTTLCRQG